MSTLIRVAATSLVSCWISCAIAQQVSPIDKYYRNSETDIRADYANFFELAEVERKRKLSAGEPALSAKDQRAAESAIRQILYNKAVTRAICAEQGMQQSKDYDAVKRLVEICFQ